MLGQERSQARHLGQAVLLARTAGTFFGSVDAHERKGAACRSNETRA
jgi:hypothetical protein